jgi:AGCS family alanine or glycine:cation symporter
MSIDQIIDNGFKVLADVTETLIMWSATISFDPVTEGGEPVVKKIPFIVVWLAAAAFFFTFYLNFLNLRHFKHAFDCLRQKFHEPDAKGQISNFDSLAACLSATIGLGNIAGVAVAVTIGGAGAAFWMGLMGLFGMASKYAEVTMGLKYRTFSDPSRPDEVSGGPMYYIRAAFEQRNLKTLGLFMAAAYAVFCLAGAIGAGNMFQANQVYQQVLYATGGTESFLFEKAWMFGIGLAVLAGLVTLGGVQSLARVTSKLTPAMAGLYILAGFAVIAVNYQNIIPAVSSIFTSAWSLEAGWGGFIGAIIAGMQRAFFATEAGIGTAAIIQASAKTNYPVRQGLVGGLGPFLDTFFVCMITALVIVISGVDANGSVEGIALTSAAFETVFPWFDYVLTMVVFLFAYSTIIVYSYYGEKCLGYLIGERKSTAIAFRIIFLCFVVVGAASSLTNVVRFADAVFLSMAIPNIIALYLLAPELKRDTKAYLIEMGLLKK